MKTFDVLKHPSLGRRRAVKQGFSWPAFFFAPIWAFLNRLWFRGALTTALIVISRGFEDFSWTVSVPGVLLALVDVSLAVIAFGFGFKGNAWKRQALERRGFMYLRTVYADSLEAAEAREATETGR
jgi:hypothetical protein